MNVSPKTLLGLALLAVGGFLVWRWNRNRTAGTGTAPQGSVAELGLGGQVGSNYAFDSTPDLVKLALEFAREQTYLAEPCWRLVKQEGGYDYYAPLGTNDPASVNPVPTGTVPVGLKTCTFGRIGN